MTDEEITAKPIQEALDAFLVELLGYLPTVTHRWQESSGLPKISSHRRDSSCPADSGEPAAALSGTDVAWGLTPDSGRSVRLWKRVLPHLCVSLCGRLCGSDPRVVAEAVACGKGRYAHVRAVIGPTFT
jgi:hypothetical protein